MPYDLEFWKRSEGQIADSLFPLERCAGVGSRGAVFETQFKGRPAAIKIVPGTPESIEARLGLWEKAASLSHPALVQIFACGEAAVGDMRCAYVVMERGDEILADVLAERPLTPDETREMLFPLLGAVQYLHGKGFAHGGLKPANIMAVGEQLKISSDGLVPGGDSAADCGAIGVLVREVLGGGQNAELPEPFAEIARQCSMADPADRWNPAQIEACLRGDTAPQAEAGSVAKWWALAAAAAVIVGLVVFWPSRPNPPSRDAGAAAPTGEVVPGSAAPLSTPTEASKPAGAAKTPRPSPLAGPVKAPAEQRPVTLDGITQVLPEIPQTARRTITGRVRINVRVRVDSAGSVSQASLEPPRASKYFSQRTLEAARAWKFPAVGATQDWMLHFDLTREQTRVSAAKLSR